MATPVTIRDALCTGWPEYLMEGACLGTFMLSACLVTVLFEYPGSPAHQTIPDAFLRLALIGIAMGLTLIGIAHSPWGKQSGAHMNPAFTLTFLSLGKIAPARAAFYILGQFAGGAAGVLLAYTLTGQALADASVNFAVTQPGAAGPFAAFAAELFISFLMMGTVLILSNNRRLAQWTPYAAGLLVALFITFEAPVSGMSMNPARTVASAIFANQWTGLWIYFTAPMLGMFLAGAFYRHRRGVHRVFCAKLHHHNDRRCLFHCNHGDLHAN